MKDMYWVQLMNAHLLWDGYKELANVQVRGGRFVAEICCDNEHCYRSFEFGSLDEAQKFTEEVIDQDFLEDFDYPNEVTP